MLSPFAASESSGMLRAHYISGQASANLTATASPGQHTVHLLANDLALAHDVLSIGIEIGIEVVLRPGVSCESIAAVRYTYKGEFD